MSTYDPFDSSSDGRPSEPLLSLARLGQIALVLALAVVVARATVLELVRDPFEVVPGQVYAPVGTGPCVTLFLNLLALVPALLVLSRRALLGDRPLSGAWAPLLLAALGVLATASAYWASDKFPSLITGSTLVAAGALCWAIAQTVRSWGRFRLVTALLAGMLLVYGTQGLFYRFVELPDLQAEVERSRERILEERGLEPGSFAAEQFMRRISAGEMVGFGSSPNTYAAVVVMLAIVTAGLFAHGIANRRDPVLMVMLVAGLVVAIWVGSYTRSRTAMATPMIAAAIVAGAWLLRGHAARYRSVLFAAGVGFVGLMVVAVVGHGLYHGSLPSDSMNFRWRYWVGSWPLFLDHLWAGVGYANFGAHYLAHRLPAAAEEIRDPHNLFVRFATELGIGGLLLSVAWLVRGGWEATRPITYTDAGGNSVPAVRGLPIGVGSLAAVCGLGMLLNIFASVDFSADAPFVVIELFKRLMFLGVLVVGATLAFITSRASTRPDDAPARWSLWAAGAAVAVFLIHNLVDFSLFETSSLFLFAALFGAVIGVRSGSPAAEASNTGRIGAGCVALGVVAGGVVFATTIALPICGAEHRAREGDEFLRTSRTGSGPPSFERVAASAEAYRRAFEAVPYNAEYAARVSRAWSSGRTNLPEIRRYLDLAVATDPMAIRPMLDRARLELVLPAGQADLTVSLGLYDRITRLNPNDVILRVEYATLLERMGRGVDARAELETALRFNDLLDPTEPKRLSPDKLAALRARVAAMPTTMPAR